MVAISDRPDAPVTAKSFRDPSGTVLRYKNRILRAVQPASAGELESFLATQAAQDAAAAGKLVSTVRLSREQIEELDFPSDAVFEHERIPFPSFPHEWPAEMLAEAGALTVELFRGALTHGFRLKDATPYNVMFRGPQPVFVDLLSFERHQPRDATWMAYAQFVRTFLLPLLAHRHFGVPPSVIFSWRRDGLEPTSLYQWAGFWKRLSPAFWSLVTLPSWLTGKAGAEPYRSRLADSAEQAAFILDHLLSGCAKKLKQLTPPPQQESNWTGYLDHGSLYSVSQLAAKERFVREALDAAAPKTVLDVGANEGRFSMLAAERGAAVVAIDSDPVVAGKTWREARKRNLNVLPLVVDLTRPTPALGWENQECDSFLARARGQFDLVLMLAVVHHMLVTERVPLREILRLAADLTRDYLVIEFVAPQDPMFQSLVRGREALYSHLNFATFEAAAAAHFQCLESHRLDGLHRCLYLLRRNGR